MIIKCPNCNGALEYNVEKGLMYCKFCESFFTAEEIAMPETDPVDEDITPVASQTSSAYVNPLDPSRGGPYANLDQPYADPSMANQPYPNQPFGRQPDYAKKSFASMDDISSSAYDARATGVTGGLVYNYSSEEREKRRNDYYEEQARLHEEFINAPKVDYTKPYISRADAMDDVESPAERAMTAINQGRDVKVDRAKAYYEEQARLHEEYINRPKMDYTKPYAGTTREKMTPEERIAQDAKEKAEFRAAAFAAMAPPGFQNVDYKRFYQENPDQIAPHFERDKKNAGIRYTAYGARIINDRNMLVTTDAPIEDGESNVDMDNRIYTCTSCGAELAISGVETSSFCAYCGQPTIVFDRMEKTKMPDYIIPFHVTKDQALKMIRDRLQSGIFVPNEVKKFEVERLCGIYIPYWLFDAKYTDTMTIRTKVKSGKTTVTRYYRINTGCNLYYYPVDASRNLNDNISKKLEPYDYNGIRPFNPSYMSGFYSDRFDMSADTMMMTSMYRAQGLMYEKAKKRVPGTPQGIVDSYPIYHVKKKYYTMLPAWFMTFRYEGTPYTILVNGQNGKVVGAVPYAKGKFYGVFAGMFAAFSAVLVPLFIFIFKSGLSSHSSGDGFGKIVGFAAMAIIALYVIAGNKMSRFKKNMELSKEKQITKFVKERQEV